MKEWQITQKLNHLETTMEFVERITASPLSRKGLVKWTFGLLISSSVVRKPIFYVWHKITYYSRYSEDAQKTVRVSEKPYKASKMKHRMDNAHPHSRRFGLGDYEQTQSTTVFLVITQHSVVLQVKANMWNGIQRFSKRFCNIPWKHQQGVHATTTSL
jgi:hypothetical protein